MKVVCKFYSNRFSCNLQTNGCHKYLKFGNASVELLSIQKSIICISKAHKNIVFFAHLKSAFFINFQINGC